MMKQATAYFFDKANNPLLIKLHHWLTSPPPYLGKEYAYFYALSNYTHAMGLLAHCVFFILFVLIDMPAMAGFNVLSILVFTRTLLWSKQGMLDHALLVGGLEVAAHQGFAVAMLGLDASFQNYVFILVVGTLFFSHIRLSVRVVMAIMPVLWYVFIFLYGLHIPPLYVLPLATTEVLAVVNSIFFITMLMGMAIYFQYSVAQARIHAEKMAASKTLFLANMSHELRTPLNAILGFSQILNRSEGLTSQERDNLATINRSGEHLLTLINHILDMSKMEEGKLELKQAPVDLGRMLDEVCAMFSLAARDKGLRLDVEQSADLPLAVLGDELRLRQILINLLNNAIKFTEHGGVFLRASQTAPRREGSVRVRFEVEDSGIGIAPEESGDLFQIFTQTESGRQSRRGTGLGLALSRRFVELMGGTIGVDSTPGQGSLFWFEIETETADPGASGFVEARPLALRLAPENPAMRLLVVDDQPDNREVLYQLLVGWGFEVRVAVDGREAVAEWHEFKPDLVWMDLRMPVMDGFEACLAMQQAARDLGEPPPKVIAITASHLGLHDQITPEQGFIALIGKPFHEVDIRSLLETHLNARFVEWMRSVPEAAETAVWDDGALAAGLKKLDAAQVAPFQTAVMLADFDSASEAIASIATQAPELAKQLRRLLEEYRFDRLHRLMEI